MNKSNSSLIIAILIGTSLWWVSSNYKKLIPSINTDIAVEKFDEPVGAFKNNLPDFSGWVKNDESLGLAYFYKNFAYQIKNDEDIKTTTQVRDINLRATKTLQNNLKEKITIKDLADKLDSYVITVVTKENKQLDSQLRDALSDAFKAIAWGFYNQSRGSLVTIQAPNTYDYTQYTNGLLFSTITQSDEEWLAKTLPNDYKQIMDSPLLYQKDKDLEKKNLPEYLTNGLIVDKEEIKLFTEGAPKFGDIGLPQNGQGKTRLLYPSLLKFDPKAFDETQTTGDCFIAGTKVLMADDSEKNIEDVQVGEYVRTPSGNVRKVLTSFKKDYDGRIYKFTINDSDQVLECTEDHKIDEYKKVCFISFCKKMRLLKKASKFFPGEFVVVREGKVHYAQPISKIETYHFKGPVYCIEVDTEHQFFANKISVSNCASHAGRNAVDVARAFEIDFKNEAEDFIVRSATEPIYGSRGHAGQGMSIVGVMRFINEQGGIALRKKYDNIDLSVYNSKIGSDWGRSGVPRSLIDVIDDNQVDKIAFIKTVEEARDSIYNGFPIICGSDHAYEARRDEYGIAKRDTGNRWLHAMAWTAVSNEKDLKGSGDPNIVYFLVQNSWGKWNGGSKGRYDIPDGSFWIHQNNALTMIKQDQTFAIGNCEGFPLMDLKDFGFENLR